MGTTPSILSPTHATGKLKSRSLPSPVGAGVAPSRPHHLSPTQSPTVHYNPYRAPHQTHVNHTSVAAPHALENNIRLHAHHPHTCRSRHQPCLRVSTHDTTPISDP